MLGVVFLVASLLLGGLFTLFPYADRQSMESALRIMASTLATFVGFILVALALIAGRASDAREHLEAVAPRYKDFSKLNKVRSRYLRALYSQSVSLDKRPSRSLHHPPSQYTHREIYTSLQAIYLMLIQPHGSPGWKNVVMDMSHRGLSSKEIDRVLENARVFDRQPHEFFKALRKVMELETVRIDESGRPVPSSDLWRELREKWESDRISGSLDRVERHERATGGRFWAAVLCSVVGLVGSVLLALGLTDVTLQLTTVRIGLVGVVIAWSMAIVLIIAYLRQLL